jgi:hypothetical protein
MRLSSVDEVFVRRVVLEWSEHFLSGLPEEKDDPRFAHGIYEGVGHAENKQIAPASPEDREQRADHATQEEVICNQQQ